jgi:hypothetical protein
VLQGLRVFRVNKVKLGSQEQQVIPVPVAISDELELLATQES